MTRFTAIEAIDRVLQRRGALGVLLGALLGGQSLFAQTATEPPRLEEIVVEATRMSKRLDRVPAAISVVGQDDIQLGRQQLGLDESLSRVPGLFMQNRFNFAQDLRVSIRGFGARANFGIRGIKILVDGIPETLPDGQGQVDGIDLGATQQIEIIRGPSSSLYGNASGGVIAVTSEGGSEEPFTQLRLTGGEFDFHKLQLKASGRTERVDYFVSLSDSQLEGFRAHSESENTQITGRVRFDLGDDRDLLTVFHFTDQPVSNDPGGITAAQAAADPRAAFGSNVAFAAGEDLTQSRLGFVYTMDLGERHQVSARNYYVWRDFGNKLPFAAGGAVDLDRFFAGGGISYTYDGFWRDKPNRLIVGVDFDDQDDDRRRFDNNFGVLGPLVFDQNETVRSQGIFVQNELSLGRNVELSFGLRRDRVEFDVQDRFLDDGDDSGRRSLEDTSPMLGILVALTPGLNVYGTVSTAFETPTTTEFADPLGGGGFNPGLDPQTARNFEVGVRGSADSRYRYEASIFKIIVEDELIPFEIASSPGRDFFSNAGESNRTGLEFSFTARLNDRFQATASYTYSDFEFEQFVDADGNDFSGNTLPGSVENLVFGELGYFHPSGWYGVWDFMYVDALFANNANTVTDDAYTLSNLRMGFERDAGAVTISPFLGVNNVFDETYNANVRINAFGGRFFEPAPGRNVYAGISLGYRFR